MLNYNSIHGDCFEYISTWLQNNSEDTVQNLLNYKNTKNFSALGLALKQGKIDWAIYFLQCGANLREALLFSVA